MIGMFLLVVFIFEPGIVQAMVGSPYKWVFAGVLVLDILWMIFGGRDRR
jgi:hypothetical protein